MKLRVFINDRNYSSWEFYDFDTNKEINKDTYPKINPLEMKFFAKDIITEDGELVFSHIKTCTYIAGVLLLENNKTFGRTSNKKRLLYKCIPDDQRLPSFLVPYDIQLGFSKNIKNKYVLFKFDNWNNTHPQGLLVETLGDVDKLNAFYEYQLYCRNINQSISNFSEKTREVIKNIKYDECIDECIDKILKNPDFVIETRTDEYMFTIDPYGSKDLDDGFSITSTQNRGWKISIYIANVFFWLETFKLWNSFSKRVSTIYLPDRSRPMLPSMLSENLCSLLENQNRFAFCMDVYLDENAKIIKNHDGSDKIEWKNVLIKVNKNFAYEEPKLVNNKHYRQLFDITTKLNNGIVDSHDVVSYWMIFMNSQCGKKMVDNKFGIFRSVTYNNLPKQINSNEINEDTKRVIQNWNNLTGQYIIYSDGVVIDHEIMNDKSYIHITSPIRRLIDQLNQILFFKEFKLIKNVSEECLHFLNNWMDEMEYINTSMRSIRKVQTDCELMTKCCNHPEILQDIHEGIIFDKTIKNDGFITYMVYLENIKLLSRITTTNDLETFTKQKFKLFFFGDEYNIKRKIRLQINI